MPTFPTHVDTAALSRRLNSSDDRERKQAQAELYALIADDVRRIKQIQALAGYSLIAYALIGLALSLSCLTSVPTFLPLIILPTTCVLFSAIYLLSRWKNRVALNVAFLDIPQATGPLIEVYASTGFAHSPQIKMALIRLLPRLQAVDIYMLTPTNLNQLYRILYNENYYLSNSPAADPRFVIAILRALEQIGDKQALPRVERMARTARNLQVRAAAQECLPYLTVRAEQTRVEQTLLRASASTASPDMLLRPTVAAAPTEPQQLLRASHMENDTDAA